MMDRKGELEMWRAKRYSNKKTMLSAMVADARVVAGRCWVESCQMPGRSVRCRSWGTGYCIAKGRTAELLSRAKSGLKRSSHSVDEHNVPHDRRGRVPLGDDGPSGR